MAATCESMRRIGPAALTALAGLQRVREGAELALVQAAPDVSVEAFVVISLNVPNLAAGA
jgi:hypothetical protein